MFKRFLKWIYNKITWKSKKKKYAEFIKHYRQHPIEFCEDFLGIRLNDCQKNIIIKFKNGSTITTIPNRGKNVRSKRGEEQLDAIRGYRMTDLESEIFHGWQDLNCVSNEEINEACKPFLKEKD